MTDLDPEIWNNRTLGAAAQNENLERVTRQAIEDRSARIEDREPREIVHENTYPGWAPEVAERTGTVPSNYQAVHFADENPNDIPQTGEGMQPEGISDEEWNAEQSESEETENSSVFSSDETPAFADNEVPNDEAESTDADSTEESDSSKWQS